METLFNGFIEPLSLKYRGAVMLAKAAFYGDYRAETAGTERVGGPYIGFPGPPGLGPTTNFSYHRPFGLADARLSTTPTGLVMVP